MKATTNLTLICALLSVFTSITAVSQPSYPQNPEEGQLIYEDIIHFVNAYEKLNMASDTLAVLKEFYFDRGTTGLTEYIGRHGLTPKMLKEAIGKYPERYNMISDFLENMPELEEEYHAVTKQFHNVLPTSMYPPTYLLVGANRGIAQASKVGQLVTITRVVDNKEKLKTLIVHELVHFQQAMSMGMQNYGALYGQKDNMLGLCLREGGAEFITSLVLGYITQLKSLAYYEENEKELKEKFEKDLGNQAIQYWMWDSIENADQPMLMGYVMGYQISKAYYEKAQDQDQALEHILVMKSPTNFLLESGYLDE